MIWLSFHVSFTNDLLQPQSRVDKVPVLFKLAFHDFLEAFNSLGLLIIVLNLIDLEHESFNLQYHHQHHHRHLP